MLKLHERETIINYDEEYKTASVYTCSPVLMRKLKKLSEQNEEIKLERKDQYSVTYAVPKSWIYIRKPTKRELTEKQRKASSENMKKIRAKQIEEQRNKHIVV